MIALADRVSMAVERADFDDLVTLVTQAPTWEKDRLPGVRILLRAIGEGKANAPDQILARWTWRLARATRKVQDRRASAEFPEAKRLLGALANSRGHRHEENAARARQRRARAADRGRRRAPRLRRGLHAARDEADRGGAGAARHAAGGRVRARREPARAEGGPEQVPPAEAAQAGKGAAGRGAGAGRRGPRRGRGRRAPSSRHRRRTATAGRGGAEAEAQTRPRRKASTNGAAPRTGPATPAPRPFRPPNRNSRVTLSDLR